ncbi:hypothetical protein NDN08_005898 [Rhodosorus marinus]|uniref:Uncharacterized protein n=1 Tax=Rhodosorus marinus TaxID=101924 RepID=A0AAV8V5L0_9RHOD|nr:hypothetical protein NDN08_005898 [Rhodosorus marinus]
MITLAPENMMTQVFQYAVRQLDRIREQIARRFDLPYEVRGAVLAFVGDRSRYLAAAEQRDAVPDAPQPPLNAGPKSTSEVDQTSALVCETESSSTATSDCSGPAPTPSNQPLSTAALDPGPLAMQHAEHVADDLGANLEDADDLDVADLERTDSVPPPRP